MKRPTAASVVYVLGVVLAISAAAKVPAPGRTWPDTMPLFAVGVAACIVSLVAWRISLGRATGDRAGDGRSAEATFGYARDARHAAVAIAGRWDQFTDGQLRQEIDRLLLEFITPFVDNRDVLIRRFGMRRGAELVLAVSAAERNLNRVWSAAADGCLPEARASLQRAIKSLDELVASIESIERTYN